MDYEFARPYPPTRIVVAIPHAIFDECAQMWEYELNLLPYPFRIHVNWTASNVFGITTVDVDSLPDMGRAFADKILELIKPYPQHFINAFDREPPFWSK